MGKVKWILSSERENKNGSCKVCGEPKSIADRERLNRGVICTGHHKLDKEEFKKALDILQNLKAVRDERRQIAFNEIHTSEFLSKELDAWNEAEIFIKRFL